MYTILSCPVQFLFKNLIHIACLFVALHSLKYLENVPLLVLNSVIWITIVFLELAYFPQDIRTCSSISYLTPSYSIKVAMPHSCSFLLILLSLDTPTQNINASSVSKFRLAWIWPKSTAKVWPRLVRVHRSKTGPYLFSQN